MKQTIDTIYLVWGYRQRIPQEEESGGNEIRHKRNHKMSLRAMKRFFTRKKYIIFVWCLLGATPIILLMQNKNVSREKKVFNDNSYKMKNLGAEEISQQTSGKHKWPFLFRINLKYVRMY